MRRKILLIFISIGYAIFINSCEYNPVGEYVRNANENVVAPEIQVLDLNLDLDNDTIYLYTGLEVAFRFNSTKQGIKNIKFTVDGKEMYNDKIPSGDFYINYGEINEGIHTLALEIVTSTGSGSIAEHIGAEGFLFSKSWILVVDKSFTTGTRTTSINGFLKLIWTKYRNSDFKEYIITRDIGSLHEVELKRTHIAEFTDSSYIGEGASYYVKLVTSSGNTIPWGNTIVKPELPVLSIYASNINQYVIKWGYFKYYNAVATFNLYQSLDNAITYSFVKTSTNYSDSIMNITNSFFGDKIDFRLTINPKINNIMYNSENHAMFESNLSTHLGFKFVDGDTRLEEIYQVSDDEFVSNDRCTNLILYSISQKKSVDFMSYQPLSCSGCMFKNIAVSSSGKYLTSSHLCDGNTMLIPSDNLNNYTLSHLSCGPPQCVSDIGTCIANIASSGFYIYDISSNTVLLHYTKPGFNPIAKKISSGGDFIFFTDDSLRLVKYSQLSFSKIWSDAISNIPKYFAFDSSNPEQIAIWDGTVFKVKQCSSFSTIYEFPLTEAKILNIDYFNKEILTYTPGSPGHLFVRDYTSGDLIKMIAINLDPVMWYTSIYLINHSLVCMNGYMDSID